MLKSPLFWKITTLIGCIVLLSLPLMMVRELINERADYRRDVYKRQTFSSGKNCAGNDAKSGYWQAGGKSCSDVYKRQMYGYDASMPANIEMAIRLVGSYY